MSATAAAAIVVTAAPIAAAPASGPFVPRRRRQGGVRYPLTRQAVDGEVFGIGAVRLGIAVPGEGAAVPDAAVPARQSSRRTEAAVHGESAVVAASEKGGGEGGVFHEDYLSIYGSVSKNEKNANYEIHLMIRRGKKKKTRRNAFKTLTFLTFASCALTFFGITVVSQEIKSWFTSRRGHKPRY
jgi:hypothetical protein